MPKPVMLIANLMLPKSPLPKKFFISIGMRGVCAARNVVFDQPPARRKIIVGFRQLPDAMQMIGKNNNRINTKWARGNNVAKCISQAIVNFGLRQPRPPIIGHDGEEITPATLIGPPIVAHSATIIGYGGQRRVAADPPVLQLMVDPLLVAALVVMPRLISPRNY